ncbi:MAG: hypothetical protein JXR94_03140, partial [Candidatus Hydrogenedentes bacterium]|nr:hypothetical protein [Candidatus Hydrogenedentota bacterium]
MLLITFLLGASLDIQGPDTAAWTNARCELAPEAAGVAAAYDFAAFPQGCWFRRAYAEEQDLRPYRFLRFDVDGDGSGT